MLEILFAALLAMLAGTSLVIQQVLNTTLRAGLQSAVWAGFVSYAVGTLSMLALAVAQREPVPFAALGSPIPAWAWFGGLFGAIYIALAILLVPQLGAATFIGLLVAGQMIAAIVIDHFGLFGLAHRPADLTRLSGVVLLMSGVILIRR